jgi:hypothetical protein
MNDLADKEFQLALAVLENCRRYIAAHKTQRWDAVKWGVSVNLALAVAATIPALAEIQTYLLVLSCGVAAASWLLVLHYNRRVAGIRKQVVTIIAWMKERGAWTMTPSSVKTPKMHIRVERIMTFKNSYCSWAF